MRKFIELVAIDLASERAVDEYNRMQASSSSHLRVVGEDDLEQPVTEAVEPAPAPQLVTHAITIYEDQIREFYPRKRGKEGTRIVLINGGSAWIVQETYDEVKAKLHGLNN